MDVINMTIGPGVTRYPHAPQGLRERKKADKWARIQASARKLFADQGYGQVTTSQLAAAAEVGVGTLFRYAGSKAELLVTVMNEQLRFGTEQGLSMARHGADLADAIAAMLKPMADECLNHPENAMAYQKEVLFGTGPGRATAVDRLIGLEDVVTEMLRLTRRPDSPFEDTDLPLLAHSLVATIYLDIVRAGLGATEVARLPQQARASVDFLLRGF